MATGQFGHAVHDLGAGSLRGREGLHAVQSPRPLVEDTEIGKGAANVDGDATGHAPSSLLLRPDPARSVA